MAAVWEVWLFAAVGVFMMFIAWTTATPSLNRLRSEGETFARAHRAYVAPEFVPEFDRLTLASFRFKAIGTLVAFVFLVAFSILHLSMLGPFAVQIGTALAAAVWAVVQVRIAGREFPPPPGRPALARPRGVVLSDYVPPRFQALLWLDVGLSAVVVLAVAAADPDTVSLGAFLAAVGVGAATLVAVLLLLVAGRAMCERPQASIDGCHLYLKDAWRARYLITAFSGVQAWAVLSAGVLALALNLPGWVFTPAVFVGLLLLGLHLAGYENAKLHFRRRLWPTLGDHVLMPGEPIPPRREEAA